MKRLILFFSLILFTSVAHGQVSSQRVIYTTANPPTVCSPGKLYTNKTTHKVYLGSSVGGCTDVTGGSTGITNGAANNVIPKSDGTNLVTSNLSDSGTKVTSAVQTQVPVGDSTNPGLIFDNGIGGIFGDAAVRGVLFFFGAGRPPIKIYQDAHPNAAIAIAGGDLGLEAGGNNIVFRSAAIPLTVTVATLPATPVLGQLVVVTDGDAALAWGATVVNTGAGATKYLVWYNGAAWKVYGK